MTNRRKWLVTFVVVAILAAIILFFTLVWRPESPAIAENADLPADEGLIARGYALAQLGNCESCHTAEGGEPYAGGRPMETPFGVIYSVNITPDRETGIGAWSEEAFTRAMREGVDREGAHLYPAFPYTHFTKIDDADMAALHAFSRVIPPVRSEAPENELPFPFNIRILMAGWNLLFLDNERFDRAPEQSDEWNAGRYLVEGIAHCGACHTPRNSVGAEKSSEALAGAEINGWFAPPLKGDGARHWTTPQLAAYFSTGFSRDHGAAAGPMGETVVNLANAAPADISAIATYVSSLTEGAEPMTANIDNGAPDQLSETHALWLGACATCHEPSTATARGETNPSYGVPLSHGGALHTENSLNAVRTIVAGIDAYRDLGGPFMPAFGDSLTPTQIADMTRYVRARFSDNAAWSDVDGVVERVLDEQNEGDGR